nr:hypothetical protein [Algoriphagus limi]
MKKLVPVLLFLCFVSYHFGYYLYYFSSHYQLEQSWQDKIYSEQTEGLEERFLEIPLSAPYMADQDEYQLTNTRFEKDGKYYRAIKQRYQKDTLQIIYVPDTARRTLESTVQKWISFLTENDYPGKSENSTQLKVFIKDYVETPSFEIQWIGESPYLQHQGFIFSTYKSPFFQLTTPPPQFA